MTMMQTESTIITILMFIATSELHVLHEKFPDVNPNLESGVIHCTEELQLKYFPNAYGKEYFYKCQFGRLMEFKCPSGKFFDFDELICVLDSEYQSIENQFSLGYLRPTNVESHLSQDSALANKGESDSNENNEDRGYLNDHEAHLTFDGIQYKYQTDGSRKSWPQDEGIGAVVDWSDIIGNNNNDNDDEVERTFVKVDSSEYREEEKANQVIGQQSPLGNKFSLGYLRPTNVESHLSQDSALANKGESDSNENNEDRGYLNDHEAHLTLENDTNIQILKLIDPEFVNVDDPENRNITHNSWEENTQLSYPSTYKCSDVPSTGTNRCDISTWLREMSRIIVGWTALVAGTFCKLAIC